MSGKLNHSVLYTPILPPTHLITLPLQLLDSLIISLVLSIGPGTQ